MIINNIFSLNSSIITFYTRLFSNQILLTTSAKATATDLNLNDFMKGDNNNNYNDDEIDDININQEDIININDELIK